MKYAILLEPQPEGGFTVTVPDLPGCVNEGETEEECRANIIEAIEGWIETAVAHNWPVPSPSRRFDFVEVKASKQGLNFCLAPRQGHQGSVLSSEKLTL